MFFSLFLLAADLSHDVIKEVFASRQRTFFFGDEPLAAVVVLRRKPGEEEKS